MNVGFHLPTIHGLSARVRKLDQSLTVSLPKSGGCLTKTLQIKGPVNAGKVFGQIFPQAISASSLRLCVCPMRRRSQRSGVSYE